MTTSYTMTTSQTPRTDGIYAEDFERLLPLNALRKRSRKTQAEMAAALGTSQAAISKLEGRGDFLLSTLLSYVEALGGKASVKIDVEAGSFTIEGERDQHFGFWALKLKDQPRTYSAASTTELAEAVVRG